MIRLLRSYKLVDFSEQCYRVVKTATQWSAAALACVQSKGRIAEFKTFTQFLAVVPNAKGAVYWTGKASVSIVTLLTFLS